MSTIIRIAESLDASVDLMVRWEGAQLDHLLDAAHASVSESTAATFGTNIWAIRSEVSFNHYGDCGRVDLLAWHEAMSTLAVVEVKSALGDLQETLGRLDVKTRLGAVLAREQGWPTPISSLPVLVIGDGRRARSVVAEHPTMLARFNLRGRQARAWIRNPRRPAPTGLLWFANVPDSHGMTVIRHRRVRNANPT